MCRDVAVRINEGLFSPQLDDLSDDYHIFAHVRVEVGAGDARACSCLHGRLSRSCITRILVIFLSFIVFLGNGEAVVLSCYFSSILKGRFQCLTRACRAGRLPDATPKKAKPNNVKVWSVHPEPAWR